MRSRRPVWWPWAAAAVAVVGAALTAAPPQAVQGTLRLETLTSRAFGNTRTLRVLVPGQNLFDPATSTYSGLEWRVDETVQDLVATGQIPEMIVVGIDHAGRNARFHEYFPYVDRYLQPPDPDPQGSRYPEFLEITTCGRHDEAAWAGRLRVALLFLYAQRSPATRD